MFTDRHKTVADWRLQAVNIWLFRSSLKILLKTLAVVFKREGATWIARRRIAHRTIEVAQRGAP